jgi:AraC-like DNA-binding protein
VSLGITIRSLRPLVALLRAHGENPDPLLVEAGIDPARLSDPSARISDAAAASVWRRAVEATGDPHLGLHVAELVDVRAFQHLDFETEYVLFQLAAVSATVDEALERLGRFFPLSYGSHRLVLARSAARVEARIEPSAPLPPAMIDHALAWIARALCLGAAVPVAPLEVQLTHSMARVDEHVRVFGGPVRFGASVNALVLHPDAMSAPMGGHRPALAERLVERCEAQARELDLAPLADRVRRVVTDDPGVTSERIAARLGMSVRTLARRLRSEGTSVQALIDEARAALAHRYLVVERLPIYEVANRLSFSEPSTFHRAFRRWYGCAPSEYGRLASVERS